MNIWDNLPKPFLILAPMEGVTDIMFRQVIAHAGRPDLFFTEFTNVSSYASEKGRHNALERLEIAPSDSPIIAQIWGKNPEHFAETCRALASLGFSGVDLNFGCPDKHVNKAGGGAAMIKTPDLATECLRNAKKATSLPVSVKTRLGWKDPEEFKTWLPILLTKHPVALTVHLRTKKEMSKVPAHYELIPEIIKLRNQISPKTKLIINGDIKDRAHALKLHAKCPEVDGFMIGRGVFANPYCFTDHTPTQEELIELLKLHLDLFEERENNALRSVFGDGPNTERPKPVTMEQRSEGGPSLLGSLSKAVPSRKAKTGLRERSEKHYSHVHSYEPLKHYFKIYVNNFPGAKELRTKLMETHSVEEAHKILSSL